MVNLFSKIKFVNLGCPKNLVDSERMAGLLEMAGCEITEDESTANSLIINTCSFIEDARREAVESILAGIGWKSAREGRRLFVVGCLPQRYSEELSKELPEVDRFFGVGDYSGVVEAVGKRAEPVDLPLPRHSFTPRHYRYLRIADGCSNGCAFCSIPSIRGVYHSRPVDELVREAESMAEAGARELIITAQETTSYGSDLPGGENLILLLKKLTAVSGIEWIRLMYLHPPKLSEELIELVAGEDKICPYFDFPIEHISDKILRRMGRGITRAEIENKLNNIHRIAPGSAVRTSLIVGFPGEGEYEFKELTDFVARGWFDRLGVFIYSPEEGTMAFHRKQTVPPDEAEFRYETIMEIQREISRRKNESKIGAEFTVLIDEKTDDNKLFGRTVFDAPEVDGGVLVSGRAEPGEMVSVEITSAGDHDLAGVIK